MFQLHERLAADTHKLGESRLCEVLLMNDSTWPWVILVPRVPGVREIYELDQQQQQRLLAESSALSEGMMALFSGDKMNVAALGNMVPQLHLHHIIRFEGDPAWPGPVWGTQPPVSYEAGQLAGVAAKFQALLDSLA
ncbi:HIT family protein [Marinobacter daepoensis]|uniref:HIT family protein n=1 Tax=Marinobacter daepoensis TaxID=262077 RepID=A0ABS3BCQ1_9GAMM|nr:HIT family protein [Marinobacter daepoensis]MBN7769376.1 HIT family protein [Marinobacter daepoensis]MBY6078066.1 HIT family protein [Marinobacter daepoensis]